MVAPPFSPSGLPRPAGAQCVSRPVGSLPTADHLPAPARDGRRVAPPNLFAEADVPHGAEVSDIKGRWGRCNRTHLGEPAGSRRAVPDRELCQIDHRRHPAHRLPGPILSASIVKSLGGMGPAGAISPGMIYFLVLAVCFFLPETKGNRCRPDGRSVTSLKKKGIGTSWVAKRSFPPRDFGTLHRRHAKWEGRLRGAGDNESPRASAIERSLRVPPRHHGVRLPHMGSSAEPLGCFRQVVCSPATLVGSREKKESPLSTEVARESVQKFATFGTNSQGLGRRQGQLAPIMLFRCELRWAILPDSQPQIAPGSLLPGGSV